MAIVNGYSGKDAAMDQWLVKVRRYDGSVSVLYTTRTEAEAEAWARKLNEDEQSQKYYAEKFDPAHGFLRG